MTDFDDGRADDPEQYENRHRPSRRDRLRYDPNYGDYLYDQKKDKEIEKNMKYEEDWYKQVAITCVVIIIICICILSIYYTL